MKATINGITIEGTPAEILEFQRLQAKEQGYKKIPNPHFPHPNEVFGPPWTTTGVESMKYRTTVTSAGTTSVGLYEYLINNSLFHENVMK